MVRGRVRLKKGSLLRILKITLIFAGCFFMIGFTVTYHVPKLKRLILFKIEELSDANLPVKINARNLKFSVIPIGINFSDVQVTPKGDLAKTLEATVVKRVRVSLSGWGLLKGQLRVGRVVIDGADVNLAIQPPNPKSPPTVIDWNGILQLPIDQISISNVKLSAGLAAEQIHATVGRAYLRIENRAKALRVRLLADDVKIKKDENEIELDFSTQFLADEEGLYFTGIRVRRQTSYLVATGTLLGDMSHFKFKNAKTKIRSQFNMNEVTVLLRDILGNAKIPTFGGTTFVDGEVIYNFKDIPDSKLKFESKNFEIDRMKLGHVVLQGGSKNREFFVSQLQLENSGGTLNLDKTKFSVEKPYKFEGTVIGQNINVHNLLEHFDVKNVPVQTKFGAVIPCTGRIEPTIEINCKGKLENAWVKIDPNPKKPLFELEGARADGEFKITNQNVTYSASIAAGKSSATTSGVVDYQKGFKIQYESPLARFADMKQTLGFDFKGEVGLKGTTEGSSKSGVFSMALTGKEIWFEQFGVGDVKTTLNYKKGILTFHDFAGKFNQSHYLAQMRVDLTKDRLEVQGRSPFLALEDLQVILSKRVPFPVTLEGNGSAIFRVQGPFELSQMSANVDSSFFRGSVSGDSFDQFHFSFDAINGNLKTDRIQLVKGNSTATLKGTLSPTGELNAHLTTRNVQIDQSENFNRLKTNVAGTLNAESTLKGKLLDPQIDTRGALTNVQIGERNGPNSSFVANWNLRVLTGEANIIGDAIKTKFIWPFQENRPYSFDVETKDWNFAQFFGVVTDPSRSLTHATSLTSTLHLEGTQKDLKSTSGELAVQKLMVRNGPSSIENHAPLSIKIRNGVISTENFALSGENNSLKITSRDSRVGELNMNLDGRIDLLIAQILTPFLEDLRGQLSFNINLTGPATSPQFAGSAFVQNGFVRLKAFPHPFEQLNADLFFSQNKLLVNSLKGRLAGGLLSGSGQIEFNSTTDIPIEIRGAIQDSVFTVPEGMTTRGSGDFFIQGRAFPYTLGGNFLVANGSLDKKINATESGAVSVRPSPYLPKFLAEKRFSPITFDLNATLQSPMKVTIEMPQILIEAGVEGRINIKGPPDETAMTGRLTLTRTSKLTVRSNVFEITSGSVEYKSSPPQNPEINVTAESRITVLNKESEEREYDVFARFTGAAQSPNINMSSQPPIAERELLSLVTLGYMNEADKINNDVDNPSAQASSTGYQIGSQFINEQLGINKKLEKTLGLEFDYASSFDATDQAARHTFMLKKQWSPRFGTTASRSVGASDTNNVRANYKLNKNMSVIGHWEGREQSGANRTTTNEEVPNLFGIDLEFRREFK